MIMFGHWYNIVIQCKKYMSDYLSCPAVYKNSILVEWLLVKGGILIEFVLQFIIQV